MQDRLPKKLEDEKLDLASILVQKDNFINHNEIQEFLLGYYCTNFQKTRVSKNP